MHANIIACLLAVGFLGCFTALGLKSEIPSQERLSQEKEAPPNDEAGGADVYKAAVVLSVGATILSLIL
jgi:hypothetical protein